MLSIDGSYGEGGGQLVRSAVALSAIIGTPIQVRNVRARRARPGLQPQHLAAVKAAASLCDAVTTGAELQAVHFTFEPQKRVEAGHYNFDIGTAGSAPLVVQTILMPLVLAGGDSAITVTGGTHNPYAPTADYLEQVYFPTLALAGLKAECSYSKPGFYPRGGGELKLRLGPAPRLTSVKLEERTQPTRLTAQVVTGSLPSHVAERGARRLKEMLKYRGLECEARKREYLTDGAGAAVLLYSENAGFTGLGERGKPMEAVADDAFRHFEEWYASPSAIDEHFADQLVLPMCFAAGESTWTTTRCTDHLRSVVWLAQQFLPIGCEIEETAEQCTVRLRPSRT